MKEEVKKIISDKLNKLWQRGEQIGRFTNSSTLERIGNKYGIEKLIEIFENRELRTYALETHQVIPEFLIDFIALLESDLNPKSILDPWTTKESFAFRNNPNSIGYCVNQGDYRLLTEVFQINKSHISLGENAKLLKEEKRKFDFIVSFPPFGLRSNSFEDSISKDFATDLLIESSLKLEENGILGFLMSAKFAFDKGIKNVLKSKGIFINGLFYLPKGSHHPIAAVNSCFVLASKVKTEKTFVSELSKENNINKAIFENYKKNRNGKTLQLGKLIDFHNFTSFKSLENKEELTKLGKRTGNTSIKLSDISSIQTIKDESTPKTIMRVELPQKGSIFKL